MLDSDGLDFLLAFLAHVLNLEEIKLGKNEKRTRYNLCQRADGLTPRIRIALGNLAR